MGEFVSSGSGDAENGGIWTDFRKIVHQYEPEAKLEFIERFAFYERSKQAFATIQTGETALYACIILKKGVIADR